MALQEQFIPARKAFSAERSKDIYESQSSDSGLEEIGNKTFKVCSSASALSARERRHAQKAFENSLQEEFSPRYHKIHSKENQKLFLHASQILEKLNKLTSNIESRNKNTLATRNPKMRKIAMYHDKLRLLLIERSSLLLIEESVTSIKRTTKYIEDFKQMYFSEKLKMTTMPTQAFNRFVSSSDINISSLELLVKKLNAVCDMHSSLTNNYQNLINFFHTGVNIDLNKTISKSFNVLNNLKGDLFYWCHKYMVVFIQKVSLSDPNSVSPDFLLKILKAMHVYNSLLKRSKCSQSKFSVADSYMFSKFVIKQEKNSISFDLILHHLSFFEAKVGAEKIVNVISSTCKKYRQADIKRKQANSVETKKDSSEHSVIRDSEHLESKTKYNSPAHTNNFVNVLLAIIQRNQSLILKYMYSITSLEGMIVSRSRRTSDNLTPTTSARQLWDLPQLYSMDDNYTILEESYWTNFWNNMRKLILKLLFDVPYHQYGDSALGTIILWPDSFVKIFLETLKINIENKDFSVEGRSIIKQLCDCLIIHQAKLQWDKEFSVSLPAVQSHLYNVISSSQSQMSTFAGNSLYKCLCLLIDNCPEKMLETNHMIYIPVFFHLQAVIDTYVSWVNVKSRTLVASQNLSTLLLICNSDCNAASQFLEAKTIPLITELSSSSSVKRLHPSLILFLKSILKQIDLVCVSMNSF